MRQSQKPPNPKSTLISGIIFSVALPPLFFIFIRYDIPFIFAPMLSAICAAYFVYAYFREKKADTSAKTEMQDFLDDSYFRSSEWREKYLRYIQKNNFEKSSEHGMKSDLTEKYRNMASLPLTLIGTLMLLWAIFQIFAGRLTVFGVILFLIPGPFLIYLGAEKYLAIPVKKLYKRNDIDISDVENSYDNGKLLTYKKCGINIGTDFLVIYDEKNVDVIKLSNVRSFSRHITRLKKYDGTLYAGEEYLHKVRIIADKEYLAELDEYQVEMAVNELNRFVNIHVQANVSENYNNQIV